MREVRRRSGRANENKVGQASQPKGSLTSPAQIANILQSSNGHHTNLFMLLNTYPLVKRSDHVWYA